MGQERSFLDQLMGLLQQVKAGNTGPFETELAASSDDDELTTAVYAALAARERELKKSGRWSDGHGFPLEERARLWVWLRRTHSGALSRRVHQDAQTLSKLNGRTVPENVRMIVDLYATKPMSFTTNIERNIAVRCIDELVSHKVIRQPVAAYALEVGAIIQADGAVTLSMLGDNLLRLRGRDLVRMLLANEVVRSTGDHDDWRISARTTSVATETRRVRRQPRRASASIRAQRTITLADVRVQCLPT